MKIKEDALRLPLEFWNYPPIELVDAGAKKKLTDTDVMALRYCAIELIQSFFEQFDEPPYSCDDENAIQDDELYLGNFEGYQVDDGVIIRTLYMNEDGRIIASAAIGDPNADFDEERIVDFLVY